MTKSYIGQPGKPRIATEHTTASSSASDISSPSSQPGLSTMTDIRKQEETPGGKSGSFTACLAASQPHGQNSLNNSSQEQLDDQPSEKYTQSTESTEQSRFASPNKFDMLYQLESEDLIQEKQHDRTKSRTKSTITSNLNKSTLNLNNDANDDDNLDINRKYTNDKRKNHQAQDKIKNPAKNRFRSKYPPIHVFNANCTQVISHLKTKLNENMFIVKNLGVNRLAVYLVDLPSFKTTIDILKLNNIEFFTRTPK